MRKAHFGRDDGVSGMALLCLFRKVIDNKHSHHFERSEAQSRNQGDPPQREFGIRNSECGITVDLLFMRLTPRSLRYVRKRTSVEMMGESGTALLCLIGKVIRNKHPHHFERSEAQSRNQGDPPQREFGIMNSECGITVDLILVRLMPGSLHYVRKAHFGRDDGVSGLATLIRSVGMTGTDEMSHFFVLRSGRRLFRTFFARRRISSNYKDLAIFGRAKFYLSQTLDNGPAKGI